MGAPPKISHLVDHELHRLCTTCVGTIYAIDAHAHFAERARLGAMEYEQLADWTNATAAISNPELEELAAGMNRLATTSCVGRTALLVGGSLNYGMARMFATYAGPDYVVNVFFSREEALEWLGWRDG